MQVGRAVRNSGLDAVIGMYPAVHRARSTMVQPWASFATGDPAVRPPRTALVYGPPGCGVTYIAHRLVDELAAAADVAAVVVDVFDGSPVAATLDSAAFRDLVVIGVSHSPWDLVVPGRPDLGFDRMVFVAPPDWDARRFRIWETSWGSSIAGPDLDRLVVATELWSGRDLHGLSYGTSNGAGPGATGSGGQVDGVDALLAAITAIRPSSLDWLERSRVLVSELGPSGQLDDLVGFLQRYRLL